MCGGRQAYAEALTTYLLWVLSSWILAWSSWRRYEGISSGSLGLCMYVPMMTTCTCSVRWGEIGVPLFWLLDVGIAWQEFSYQPWWATRQPIIKENHQLAVGSLTFGDKSLCFYVTQTGQQRYYFVSLLPLTTRWQKYFHVTFTSTCLP